MAKFYGEVGFVKTVETAPGVWTEKSYERMFKGDILRNTRRWEPAENLNSNLNINNSISIVADEDAYQNIFAIRYVKWMGAPWEVTAAEVQEPRIVLTIGGVYTGEVVTDEE